MMGKTLLVFTALLVTGCDSQALNKLVESQQPARPAQKESAAPAKAEAPPTGKVKIVNLPLRFEAQGPPVALKADVSFSRGQGTQEVAWSVSDETIGRVEGDKLHLLKAGKLELTATAKANPALTDKITLQVVDSQAAASAPSAAPPSPLAVLSEGLQIDLQPISTLIGLNSSEIPYLGSVSNTLAKSLAQGTIQSYVEQDGQRVSAGGSTFPFKHPSEKPGVIRPTSQIQVGIPSDTDRNMAQVSARFNIPGQEGLKAGPAVLIVQISGVTLDNQKVIGEKRIDVTLR